jgi:hypothetical protein
MKTSKKNGIACVFILMLSLSACTNLRTEVTVARPTAIRTSTAQTYPQATPVLLEPAAGICASFEGEAVIINIYPDIPDPRCAKANAEQKLTVINQTEDTLQVSIGIFKASLQPGVEYTFDVPFGDYLEPGVHLVQVSPCCSPELWLER